MNSCLAGWTKHFGKVGVIFGHRLITFSSWFFFWWGWIFLFFSLLTKGQTEWAKWRRGKAARIEWKRVADDEGEKELLIEKGKMRSQERERESLRYIRQQSNGGFIKRLEWKKTDFWLFLFSFLQNKIGESISTWNQATHEKQLRAREEKESGHEMGKNSG